MSNKKNLLLALVILLIFGTLFYWYSVRPSLIKKECAEWTLQKSLDNGKKAGMEGKYRKDDYEIYFSRCLKEKGL